MRIGAVRHQCVAVPDHCLRDVGVQIEAGDDRNAIADQAPHARQELALAVVEVLGDHGAVEVEIDPVHRTGRLQPC